MEWHQVFYDSPEYEVRSSKGTFDLPDISVKEIRDAVPKHLFHKSTLRSLFCVLRHLAFTFSFYCVGTQIDSLCTTLPKGNVDNLFLLHTFVYYFLRGSLLLFYWGWQGMTFAGIWCLGHEAGHDALSDYSWVNAAIGLTLHTFVLTPYYSWRTTHRTHHKATNDLTRDETYIPVTRLNYMLPHRKFASRKDYTEVLSETPAHTLFKLFVRQFFGFQLYLLHNRKGNPRYPARTSHYLPSSLIFKPEQRLSLIASNIAIVVMLLLLIVYAQRTSWSSVLCHYILPWLMAHNWIVMITYLQHTDPTIPYYRKNKWSFIRGALATVDRPLFGWAGNFFLHNISSDHIAHHLFASIPFYNLPQVTEAIKPVLGEYYNYDSTPVLYALWRSFTQCTFVEDEGEVVFFKNRYGEAVLRLNEKQRIEHK